MTETPLLHLKYGKLYLLLKIKLICFVYNMSLVYIIHMT